MQSESEKVPSVRVWRRNRPSQRNHERRESASSTAGAKRERERVEFTQTSFSFCFVLPQAMLALSLPRSPRERRSKAKRLRQSRLKNSLLYTLITWPHWHLISSFLLVEPLIIHFPRDVVATSYAYDFRITNEAL